MSDHSDRTSDGDGHGHAAMPPTSPEYDSSAALLLQPGQPASAASLVSTSLRLATRSSLSRAGLPPSASIGSDNAGASTTLAPAMPKDLPASSWAHIPPYCPMEAPTTASGLADSAFCWWGRDSQSIAFLSAPGML